MVGVGSDRTMEHGVFCKTVDGKTVRFNFKEWVG